MMKILIGRKFNVNMNMTGPGEWYNDDNSDIEGGEGVKMTR